MNTYFSLSTKHRNIVDHYAQIVANKTESQVCMVRNSFGGIDIKPLKITLVVSNPDLIGIVAPHYDPLSNARTSTHQWMQPNDYLKLHAFNKLTGR